MKFVPSDFGRCMFYQKDHHFLFCHQIPNSENGYKMDPADPQSSFWKDQDRKKEKIETMLFRITITTNVNFQIFISF